MEERAPNELENFRERTELETHQGERRRHEKWGKPAQSGSFSKVELIASLLGSDTDTTGLARLLHERDLAEVARFGPNRLAREARIAPRAARVLAAAFALGRAVEGAGRKPHPRFPAPAAVHGYLAPRVRGVEQEHVFALLLDARHALRGRRLISLGTLSESLVHPREVFGPAVRESAAAILLAHNHPSNDPTPSPQDLELTRRLAAAARLLGIPLLDHVILCETTYLSLREHAPDLWPT